jgi:hypothetical protein
MMYVAAVLIAISAAPVKPRGYKKQKTFGKIRITEHENNWIKSPALLNIRIKCCFNNFQERDVVKNNSNREGIKRFTPPQLLESY